MEEASPEIDTVHAIIQEFVFMDTWAKTRAMLEQKLSILFSPLADDIFEQEIARYQAQCTESEAQTLASAYLFHRNLIRRCKEVGIEGAWSEVEQRLHQSPGYQLIDVLQQWLNAPTDRDKRRSLECQPALLEEGAIKALDRFIEAAQAELEKHKADLAALYQQAEEKASENAWEQERGICKKIALWAKTIRSLQESQAIIVEINRRGNTKEAIREVAINYWGGFAVDIPSWIEENDRQDDQLCYKPDSEEHVLKRIALWQTVLDRAESEPSLPKVVLAQIYTRLFSACFATKGLQTPANLELGLRSLQQALVLYPRENYPRQWGLLQMNLGSLYQKRIRGSRGSNLEQSIAHYRSALQVVTERNNPVSYALLQHNLGTAFSNRLAGDREINLEDAITCFRLALTIRTREEMPEEYAMSQNTLGTILRERHRNFRETNLEMSIACHIQALRVYTLKEYPTSYAATMVNLGNAYCERLNGERQENLENALICYHEALKVYDPAVFPLDYALVQNNLGNAYSERLKDGRRANFCSALACYQAALEKRERSQFPLDHRNILLNIASLALHQFFPLAEEEQDARLRTFALELADQAFLETRTLQAELDWLEREPAGIAQGRGEYAPIRKMHTHHALTLLLLQRPQDAVVALEAGRAQALAKERALSGASLKEVCPHHARAFENARQQWQDALAVENPQDVQEAHSQFVDLRHDIREHCDSTFLPGDIDYATIAQACSQGHVLVYLAATNRGGFALVLRPHQTGPDIIWLPQLTWQAIDNLIISEESEEDRFIIGGYALALEHRAIHHLLRWTYYETDDEQREQRRHLPLQTLPSLIEPPFTCLQQALQEVVQTWQEECRSLEKQGTPEELHSAKTLRERLGTPLAELIQQREAVRDLSGDLNWRLHAIELDRLLDQLSLLGISELHSGLDALGIAGDQTRIALIPCGQLGILPLHAVPVRKSHEGETLALFETCELTYQASARSLIDALQSVQVPLLGGILAIGNPASSSEQQSLPFAQKEAEGIVKMAKQAHGLSAQVYTGEKATITRIRKEIADLQKRHPGAWIHAACHGAANPFDPERCYLLLARLDRLTLAELQRKRSLQGIRGFVASGCVTGLSDFRHAPDELGNFASGLLLAGAACAIVTLWSVSDRAMCLLMLHFYRNLLQYPDLLPAQALRQAIHWLRAANKEMLTQFAYEYGISEDVLWKIDVRGDVLRGSFPAESEALHSSPRIALPPDLTAERPFARPIFWAATIMYGC